MAAKLRAARTVVVGLTAAVLLVGEAAERYNDANRVAYVAQNLRRRLQTDPAVQQKTQEDNATSTAWLAKEQPKFPYLLGISPGDNPAKVVNAGERNSSFGESLATTFEALTAPSLLPEALLSRIGSRWKALKASLHADLPAEFDPRSSVLRVTLDEVLAALKELQSGSSDASDVSAEDPSPRQQQKNSFVVFFLRDFDEFSDSDAETWMNWIHAVTSAGLAHVVLPTTAGITPSKLDTLQARHNGNKNSNDKGDFVAILLRVAKGAVDTSSADEKLRELGADYGLGLHFNDSSDDDLQQGDTDQQGEAYATNQNSNMNAENEETRVILDAAGNWWSDLVAICVRLQQHGLAAIADPVDRVAVVRQVCEEYHQDTMTSILGQLHLDGSLNLLEIITSQADSGTANSTSSHHERTQENLALRALESWKCLEVVTGMAAAQQGLTSPQQFLMKETDKPIHCVHPVEALLPFQQRSEGEAKFLQLLDESILYLRPKSDVEIGVVPCTATSLIAPCWIETRPSIVRAFKKIWLREEIALYAQEIDERRAFLNEQRMDFVLMQFKLTPAERATRKAELSLLELEIQSKDVYLARLRSMLAA
uniref:Uncharacterized protein n=1 Tax=Globisporangium ultimum (strain ATCC 200006 / CBS 805.95 / DAOM BR144) TaxID=431595 RepID=K3X1A7_GLOUD